MNNFRMPTMKEAGSHKKYENYVEALTVAGIEIKNGEFALNMEKGIFGYVEEIIQFDKYDCLLDLGCVANPPSIKISYKNNEKGLSYVRMPHQETNRNGYFKKGVANIRNISDSLSDIDNCSETLSAGKRSARVTVFKECKNVWSYDVRGCEICEENIKKSDSLEGAIGVLIDFFNSNNL